MNRNELLPDEIWVTGRYVAYADDIYKDGEKLISIKDAPGYTKYVLAHAPDDIEGLDEAIQYYERQLKGTVGVSHTDRLVEAARRYAQGHLRCGGSDEVGTLKSILAILQINPISMTEINLAIAIAHKAITAHEAKQGGGIDVDW